jgi:hypothetical protein
MNINFFSKKTIVHCDKTGGLLLRSILNVLNNSARSLDVEDINLPLQLSDLPENWKGLTHVVYER